MRCPSTTALSDAVAADVNLLWQPRKVRRRPSDDAGPIAAPGLPEQADRRVPGLVSRASSHRQSGAKGSRTQVGRPKVPDRWATALSTVITRSSDRSAAPVSAKSVRRGAKILHRFGRRSGHVFLPFTDLQAESANGPVGHQRLQQGEGNRPVPVVLVQWIARPGETNTPAAVLVYPCRPGLGRFVVRPTKGRNGGNALHRRPNRAGRLNSGQ